MSTEPRIVFVQKFVPHYRLPFFERIREQLAANGLEFVLLCGEPDPFEGSKVKTVIPDWAECTASHHIRLRGRFLYWQRINRHLKKDDFVIVEHAAKLLDNYAMYFRHRLGQLRYGYFGHGENFLASGESTVARAAKRAMLANVTRWFAYTDTSRLSLERQGVAGERITVVNNTLERPADTHDDAGKQPDRCVYIGGLYAEKRLDLLIEAGRRIASGRPTFSLHLMGTGPLAADIQAAAAAEEWLHYHGALYGVDRDRILAQSQLMLMPGAVGLVAIDSFFFKCPIVARASTEHGPEIAYLADGENARLIAADADGAAYAEAVETLLADPATLEAMQAGCKAARDRYTIEDMADRFVAGVRQSIFGDAS